MTQSRSPVKYAVPSVTIANFPVRAGDVMFVDINETLPGVWTFTVQNRTTGRTFTE